MRGEEKRDWHKGVSGGELKRRAEVKRDDRDRMPEV